MRRRSVLLAQRVLFCALGLTGVVACSRDGRPVDARLQDALDSRVRCCRIKGASAAVILPDGMVWEGASGISHDGVQMSPEMPFAIGSITKNMVAALMLQLAEEGKLSLEDPIGKWLPTHPHVDDAITIRQLLDHTSGLFMFWDNQKIWDDLIRYRSRVFTPEDVLSYLKEPYFPPGTGYRYSNTNYLLAAMIATRATESTLAVQMRQRFWKPLGLASASLPLEEPYPANLAHVWGDNYEKGTAVRDITFLPRASHDSITYGSAGVFMTAGDLARWVHALYRGEVVGPSCLDEMRTFGPEGAYGLGLQRFGWRFAGGARAEGHGGGNIGTTAYMVHLPDHGVSLAVMINEFGGGCASRIVRDLVGTVVRPSLASIVLSPEVVLPGLWLVAGVGASLAALRKNKPLVLVAFGGLAILGGGVMSVRGVPMYGVLLAEGAVMMTIGICVIVRRIARRPRGG